MPEASILHIKKFVLDADLDFILGVRKDSVAVSHNVKLKIVDRKSLKFIFLYYSYCSSFFRIS